MLDKAFALLRDAYPLKEIEDKEYRSFKVNGMNFEVTGFSAEGLGKLSLMNAKGMAGLMKMSTIIVNPISLDAPLFSLDVIKAMGNNMLLAELYDTCLEAVPDESAFRMIGEKYSELADMETQSRWYDDIRYKSSIAKKVSGKEAEKLDALALEFVESYLELLKNSKPCDGAAKLEKARAYSHGLIENGGTSTDSFLKAWGKEKTQEFFDKVLFG